MCYLENTSASCDWFEVSIYRRLAVIHTVLLCSWCFSANQPRLAHGDTYNTQITNLYVHNTLTSMLCCPMSNKSF